MGREDAATNAAIPAAPSAGMADDPVAGANAGPIAM
jgi:hypothetical protein